MRRRSSSITKRATITKSFDVIAGEVTVEVSAIALQNFSNGAGRLQSKLKMDYYTVPHEVVRPEVLRAGPEEIDFESLAAKRTYSKISAQWVVATL